MTRAYEEMSAHDASRRLRRALLAAGLCAACLAPGSASAFWNVAVGQPVRDRDMTALDGGRQPLLGRGRVTVFVVFRPKHDRSLQTLREIARLEREWAGRPVRFVAVTSASYAPAAVRATVKEAGLRAPILLDQRDALSAELGVDVRPAVAITDDAHRLAAYEPFLSVNMHDALESHLETLLGTASGPRVAVAGQAR